MSAVIERSFLRESQCLGRPSSRLDHRAAAVTVTAVVVLLLLLLPQTITAAPAKEIRRVLVFNDLGSISSPGFGAMDQAIFAGLEKSPYQIEFYNENLETTLFSDADFQRAFKEWYVHNAGLVLFVVKHGLISIPPETAQFHKKAS